MPIIASGASESKTQPTVASHLFGPSDFTLHVQRNVSTPIGNGTADVVLSARDEVFRAILSGDQNPVMAYMSGKLRVEGNVQRALKVSGILTGG